MPLSLFLHQGQAGRVTQEGRCRAKDEGCAQGACKKNRLPTTYIFLIRLLTHRAVGAGKRPGQACEAGPQPFFPTLGLRRRPRRKRRQPRPGRVEGLSGREGGVVVLVHSHWRSKCAIPVALCCTLAQTQTEGMLSQ